MRDYLIRRMLLIPPTLLGIMVIVFIITRFVPGGPLERALMEFQQLDISSGTTTGMAGQDIALSDSQLEKTQAVLRF
eukprot:UN17668